MKYFRSDEDIFEPAPACADRRRAGPRPAAGTAAGAAADSAEAEARQKRRIVIIRHKPGEQIDVPLADELAKAS